MEPRSPEFRHLEMRSDMAASAKHATPTWWSDQLIALHRYKTREGTLILSTASKSIRVLLKDQLSTSFTSWCCKIFCSNGCRDWKSLATPLLVINFILYLIAACLAGWALNRNFDAARGTGEGGVGNGITGTFLPLALIACVVGLASALAGTHHIRVWRGDSLAAAAATSLIAWLLTLLAMGLAAKEIHRGGYRHKRLKTLEAFMIILSLFELLYLLALHPGFMSGGSAGYNHGGRGAPTVGGVPHEHHTDHGHHTDMKIPRGHVAHPVV